jgi:hypothetical protein
MGRNGGGGRLYPIKLAIRSTTNTLDATLYTCTRDPAESSAEVQLDYTYTIQYNTPTHDTRVRQIDRVHRSVVTYFMSVRVFALSFSMRQF